MKQILMIIAPEDFRDEELTEPKKIFEDAGYRVVVASHRTNKATGMLGHTVGVDKDMAYVNVADYDAVIFVGGSGASRYFDDATAHKIAQETIAKKRVLGAICIAPSILANAGLLKGRKATAWASERANLEKHGAVFTNEPVTVDESSGVLVITANGPRAAVQFGEAVVKVLKD